MADEAYSIDLLNKSNQILEDLTRNCIKSVQTSLNTTKVFSDAALRSMQENIRDSMTDSLAKVVKLLNETLYTHNKSTTPEENNNTDVFIATNFRRLRGILQQQANPKKNIKAQSTSLHIDLDRNNYNQLTNNYGRYGRNGKIDKTSNFFMPVAFWADQIYEAHFLTTTKADSFRLGGFSKFISKYGSIFRKNNDATAMDPIYCFHFELSKNQQIYDTKVTPGIIKIHFNPTNSPLDAIDCFNALIFELSNHQYQTLYFDSKETPKRHEIPIIDSSTPIDEHIQRKAIQLFSVFFYSNFEAPTHDSNSAWIQQLLADPITSSHFDEEIISLIEQYRTHCESCIRDNNRFLVFKHYYALLLNPGLSFSKEFGNSEFSPLGTINLYTNICIPPPILAATRKHFEAISHLLRDVEEWEGGRYQMRRRMINNFGHELTRDFYSAYNLLLEAFADTSTLTPQQKLTLMKTIDILEHARLLTRDSNLYNDITANANTPESIVDSIFLFSWKLHISRSIPANLKNVDITTIDTLNQFSPEKIIAVQILGDSTTIANSLMINSEARSALFRWITAALLNAMKHTFGSTISSISNSIKTTKENTSLLNLTITLEKLNCCVRLVNPININQEQNGHKSVGTEQVLIDEAVDISIDASTIFHPTPPDFITELTWTTNIE